MDIIKSQCTMHETIASQSIMSKTMQNTTNKKRQTNANNHS